MKTTIFSIEEKMLISYNLYMKQNNNSRYKINQRQIDILKKYYEVDEENKIVAVKFNLESDKEMLETSIGLDNISMFNHDLLSNINTIIESIPLGYKVDIEFDVYEEFSQEPAKTLEAFNDTLELGQYSARKDKRKKWFLATLLVVFGILLLSFMIIGNHFELFGKDIASEITNEIIDIAAWVFVWEAVTILFLEPNENKILNLRIKKRVNSIAIYKRGEEKPVVKENSDEIFGKWQDESRIKLFGKAALLISSAAFITLSFYSVYLSIEVILAIPEIDSLTMAIIVITSLITFTIYILAGIGGLSRYQNRKNFFSKLSGPFAVLLLIQLVFSITVSAMSGDWTIIRSGIFGLIIDFLYISGYFIDKYKNV